MKQTHTGQWSGMNPTVVCAVNTEDDASRRALSVGADLAERLRRPLVVAYVAPSFVDAGGPAAGGEAFVPVPGTPVPYPYPVAVDGPELREIRDEARQRIERLLEKWGVDGAEVEVALDATPADGLRRIAADRDAELLIVGSRGRGTVSAALLGSTSHALAGEAPCPVVVVPPSD